MRPARAPPAPRPFPQCSRRAVSARGTRLCPWAGGRRAAASCPGGASGAGLGRGDVRAPRRPQGAFSPRGPGARAGGADPQGREGEPAVGERPGPGTPEAAAAAPRSRRARRAGLAAAERGGSAVSLRCCSNLAQDAVSAGLRAVAGPDPAGICRGRVRAGSCGDNHVSSGVGRFGGGRGQCRGRQSASLSAGPGRGLAVAFPLPAPALGWPGLLGRTPFSFPLPLCKQLPASAAEIC